MALVKKRYVLVTMGPPREPLGKKTLECPVVLREEVTTLDSFYTAGCAYHDAMADATKRAVERFALEHPEVEAFAVHAYNIEEVWEREVSPPGGLT